MAIEFRKCQACGRSNRLTRKICFSCGANLSTGIIPPEKHEEPTPPKQIEASLIEAGMEEGTASTVVQNAVQKDKTKKQVVGGLILVALGLGLEYLPSGVIGAVLAVIIWIIVMQFSAMKIREYDADVKVSIINAVRAQEAYLKENGTYANSVSDLQKILSAAGIRQSSNVNLNIEATTSTFVISGNVKKGCSPNTGTWTYDSTTSSSIEGTRCELQFYF